MQAIMCFLTINLSDTGNFSTCTGILSQQDLVFTNPPPLACSRLHCLYDLEDLDDLDMRPVVLLPMKY